MFNDSLSDFLVGTKNDCFILEHRLSPYKLQGHAHKTVCIFTNNKAVISILMSKMREMSLYTSISKIHCNTHVCQTI